MVGQKKGFLGGGVCVVGWYRYPRWLPRVANVVTLVALTVLLATNVQLGVQYRALQAEVAVMREDIRGQAVYFDALMGHNKSIEHRVESLEQFLAPVLVTEKEVTAYAPLDTGAVQGVCRDDTPNITASGEPPEPGRTAAAGRGVPFGTMVFVLGRGWYRVNDRGGAVGNNNIDVVTETRDEALRFGRRTLPVMVVPAE